MNKRILLIAIVVAVLAAVAAYFLFFQAPSGIRIQTVKVVRAMPHDPRAFTEGLFYHKGVFYESTGEEGASNVRRVKPETGEVLLQEDLPAPYFGEGIVGWKDKLYQITWKDQQGFIYDINTFASSGTFRYTGEGWGMTHNGTNVIMSDGTSNLRFLNPETLEPVSTLAVTANGCPVALLNELEWVNGEIYANIWKTDLIARIDPKTGNVLGFLDVTALGPPQPGVDDVPNGIAWDSATNRLFVTGKNWPQLYEVTAGEDVVSSQAEALMTCAR